MDTFGKSVIIRLCFPINGQRQSRNAALVTSDLPEIFGISDFMKVDQILRAISWYSWFDPDCPGSGSNSFQILYSYAHRNTEQREEF